MRSRSVVDRSVSNPVRPARPVNVRPTRRADVRRACLEALEGRRMLSFSPAASYPVGDDPRAMAAADFNGDGRPDLAVANASGSTVSVLRGNGDGTFQPAVSFATGAGPRSLAVGDFNADGRPDLATANGSDLSVLLNNGAGGFGAPAGVVIPDAPLSVAVGDVNADGKLDLVATSSLYHPPSTAWYGYYYPGYHQSTATVLLGNGTGAFTPSTSVGLGTGSFTALAAADLNGDGRADLATSSPEAYHVQVFFGTSTGELTLPTFFTTSGSRSATAGDVNGDGRADLVTTSAHSDTINVLLNTGTGSFGASQSFATGTGPAAAAIADFNGDGKADVVTANSGGDSASVLLGSGTGTFQPPVHVGTGSTPTGVAVGDFNRDARPDVATANAGGDSASALLNDGVWPAVNAPRITVGDVTITEGNTGTASAAFTVSLSAAYAQLVTVKYATVDGSATVAAGDYQAAAGTLTFAPGETSKTIAVLVNGDRLAEDAESFGVRLADPANAFVADGTAVGTILDDEPRVTIEYNASVSEGNSGTRPLDFTVRLSSASDVPVSVNYSTAEGDTEWVDHGYYGYYEAPPAATSGVDFEARAGAVTFAPGETVKTISVPVFGDHLPEASEVLSLNLSGVSGAGAVLTAGHAVGTVFDDEPYAGIASSNVVEGNSGSTSMTFTATLSAASDVPVTISYATSDGTATVAGGDYQAKSGTVTFAPGATSQTFTVAVNGDRVGEATENFNVNVTGVTNAHRAYGETIGYITDNEAKISVADASLIEGNSGTRAMTFTVRLAAAYDQTVTVKFATVDGSATVADGDYVARSGTLTFAPGEVTKTVTVTIKGDKRKESDEFFALVLSGASANAFIDYDTGWGVIVNDDRQGGGGKSR